MQTAVGVSISAAPVTPGNRRSAAGNCDDASGFMIRLFHRHRNLNARELSFGACCRIMPARLDRFGPAKQFGDAEHHPTLERQDLLALVLTHDFAPKTSFEVIDIQHVRITAEVPAAKVEGFQSLLSVSKNIVPRQIAIGSAAE